MNINKLIEGQRREFNNEFGYRDLDFYDEYDGNDWEGASMVKPTGCNDCGKCQNARHAHREFMITQTKNTLIKFLDSEIERLEKTKKRCGFCQKEIVVAFRDYDGIVNCYCEKGKYDNSHNWGEIGFNQAVTNQITHLQDIKKQLTQHNG